jgi:8-amino-7-oxononanoate synthase
LHDFANIKKALQASWPYWEGCKESGVTDLIQARSGSDPVPIAGLELPVMNMSSYAYLGIDKDPRIVRAAADAVLGEGTLNTSIGRVRIRSALLEHAESAMGDLFGGIAMTTTSCASAAWSVLPLAASGLLTDGVPPVMVFDKNAHFCLNAMKALAADETTVVTVEHNDMETLRKICVKEQRVVYVADGVYSTGGAAPVSELTELQDKYGLLVIYDEAHGISTLGPKGVGWALSQKGGFDDRTVVIASLNKGFGAAGGVVLFDKSLGNGRVRDTLYRTSGPIMWSQRINTAGLGAIIKSVELHESGEVDALQGELRKRIAQFDSLIDTGQKGDMFPIRTIHLDTEDETVRVAQGLLRSGFYAAPIFFPIVRRGAASLRVMIRADMVPQEIDRFAKELDQLSASY